MFDAAFYQTALPDRVRQQCAMQVGHVPVVELRLHDGATLDICHIVHLAEKWLAVAYFRDADTCQEMDIAFLPYESVTRVTISLHHPEARKLGFSLEGSSAALQTAATSIGGVP